MKNALKSIRNRADYKEERISELKDGNLEIIKVEEKKEPISKKLKKLCENYPTPLEKNNIRIMRVPEGKERGKGAVSLFKKIITENFLHLGKN